MCLISRRKLPRIALTNIAVYKILCEDNSALYQQHYRYKPGVNFPEGGSDVQPCGGYTAIKGGYLHAFQRERFANTQAASLNRINYINQKVKVVKMIIPFGTRYYRGNHDDICAKKLVW